MPPPFAAPAAEVALLVRELADPQILADLGIVNPMHLTGLYEGVPMTRKSLSYPAPWPDTVWLFRQPILAELATRDGITLEELVSHVTIHEFAHHFGWSDETACESRQACHSILNGWIFGKFPLVFTKLNFQPDDYHTKALNLTLGIIF